MASSLFRKDFVSHFFPHVKKYLDVSRLVPIVPLR